MTTPAPVSASERLPALDLLRGVALFGILMVNMAFFALPLMEAVSAQVSADDPTSERFAAAFVRLFFESKFITMFSLLFGAGFIMQQRHAGTPGSIARSFRRNGMLLLIGLVHALLIWAGDILAIYACFGLLLIPLARRSPNALMQWSAAAFGLALVLMLLMAGLQILGARFGGEALPAAYAAAEERIATGEAPSGFQAIMDSNWDPNHPLWKNAEQTAFREGPFADAFAFRAATYGFSVTLAVMGYGWLVLSMFLLGAAFMRSGFFRSAQRSHHRKLLTVALPAGLLLEIPFAAAAFVEMPPDSLLILAILPLHMAGSVLVMLGYAGGLCLLAHSDVLHRVRRAISAAGRMALTVYLLQSLCVTGIMNWWGLGKFGTMSRLELIGIALTVYAVLVLLSVLWLSRFRFGPMEWLWRSFTYLRIQPLRRATERALADWQTDSNHFNN